MAAVYTQISNQQAPKTDATPTISAEGVGTSCYESQEWANEARKYGANGFVGFAKRRNSLSVSNSAYARDVELSFRISASTCFNLHLVTIPSGTH